ncbi:MAG: DUF2079 domain-containing protein [Actinomycetaceae bacterium]|nr:DUF2079 domain-containing protein [Actinomycetaceae bacterium]
MKNFSLTKVKDKVVSLWDAWAYGYALVFFVFTTMYSVVQWNNFYSPSWDLGIFTSLAQQYAHLSAPIVDIKSPNYNLLGDHFHPLLILLGPIFALFSSGLTLLIVQNFLFSLSAVPLVRYVRRQLGSLFAVIVGASYILSFGLLEAVKVQFHEIAFAVPLLSYGLVAWLEGKEKLSLVCFGLLIFVKEDLGLTVAAFGCVLLWKIWGEKARDNDDSCVPKRNFSSLAKAVRTPSARLPFGLIAWGLVWFFLSIFVITPLMNPQGQWDYFGVLADNQSEAPENEGILQFFIDFFGPGQKIVLLILLVGMAGVIGVRSPYIWLVVPTLVWRFAGHKESYWDWQWHYSAVLMPIVFIAMVDVMSHIKVNEKLRLLFRRFVPLGASLLSLCVSIGMATVGPIADYVDDVPHQMSDEERAVVQGACDAVGTDRNVVADLSLLAYVVPDNRVFWEGTVADGDGVVDTVIATPYSQVVTLQGKSADDVQTWAAEKFGGSWEAVYSQGGYIVVARKK